MNTTGRIRNPLYVLFLLLSLLSLVSLACSLTIGPKQPTPTNTPAADKPVDVVLTSPTAAATQPPAATNTPEPTATPVPTVTLVPPSATPTNVPIPCNWAQFMMDVTIPDDTEIQAGTNFTKTWQLKNVGSCTWTSGYQLIYDHGDKMAAPDAAQMTNVSVPPGSTVNVSVKLTAPAAEGTYRGYFKLRSPEGDVFGIGGTTKEAFFVQIVSKAAPAAEEPPAVIEPLIPVVPLVVLKPDLVISFIELNPNPPVKGQAVTVKVQVYNQGNSTAGAYTVAWYASENAPAPACTWPVDKTNAKGGRVLTCNYAGYPSWYASINTKAVADFNGEVNELDEGNNTLKMNIKVLKP